MKKSQSSDELDHLGTKKRKLSVTKPSYLECQICKNHVYDYELCVGQLIYCGIDCLECIVIKLLNEVQHQSFEDDVMLM